MDFKSASKHAKWTEYLCFKSLAKPAFFELTIDDCCSLCLEYSPCMLMHGLNSTELRVSLMQHPSLSAFCKCLMSTFNQWNSSDTTSPGHPPSFHRPPPADLPVAIKVRVWVILQVPVKTTPLYSKTTAANAVYDMLVSNLQCWTMSDVWWCEESKEDLWQRLFTGDNRQAAIQPPTHRLQI